MRILLAHNSLYFPSHGGGDKSNRLLLEALAGRGHNCRVVARLGNFGSHERERFLRDLADRAVEVASEDAEAVVFRRRGVEVHVLTYKPNLRAYFAGQIASFSPAAILASTDDPAQLLLEAALRAEAARVVYLARATLALPFGPDCAFPSDAKTEVLRKVDRAVGVSRYVAEYMRRWGGMDAVHVPISLLEPGPYPYLGRFDNEFVTLVNPCAVKGISIFLSLAARMPQVKFAAVPIWGTNQNDRAALAAQPNVHILDPVDNIDTLLARTRVLLVPSLWAEARSRIVVEAMLRGVPVLASNIGGIPEAKLGVDYLLPVRPIEKYQPKLDEQMVPVAEVPEQDVAPWEKALAKLLAGRDHYERLSRVSREAALSYAANLSIVPFESLLEEAVGSPRRRDTAESPEKAALKQQTPLEKLSPEKRRLLALRLRQKTPDRSETENSWFPSAQIRPPAKLRLFCFPSAGGGVSAFRGWQEHLPPAVLLCPVRLPGRESRLPEAPYRRMEPLVAKLVESIRPFTLQPFAFFGHSMGAAIAFELARRLRKHNLPLPLALFVSGARAPQFRLGHVPPPEPPEKEFLDELRRLEGIPKQVLDHPELIRVILPALRADTALYRSYVYTEEAPLECPIKAYGGREDPNVRREHLQAWEKQTTASFSLEMLPGGHFFPDTARPLFLEVFARGLQDVARALDLPGIRHTGIGAQMD